MDTMIVTSNLTRKELSIINNIELIDKTALKVYEEDPAIVFKKFYFEGCFWGYAVLFLGYNGLDSNDVSLEELHFLDDNMELLNQFLNLVRCDSYPIPVENFYYSPSNIDVKYENVLNSSDFSVGYRVR